MSEHEAPLRLRPGLPAGWLVSLPLVLVALVVVTVFATPLDAHIRTASLLGMGLAFTLLLRLELAATRRGVTEITLRASGRVRCTTPTGRQIEGFVDERAWISTWLVVVPVRHGSKRKTFAIWATAQPRDEFRRLRVWLGQNRWSACENPGSARLDP